MVTQRFDMLGTQMPATANSYACPVRHIALSDSVYNTMAEHRSIYRCTLRHYVMRQPVTQSSCICVCTCRVADVSDPDETSTQLFYNKSMHATKHACCFVPLIVGPPMFFWHDPAVVVVQPNNVLFYHQCYGTSVSCLLFYASHHLHPRCSPSPNAPQLPRSHNTAEPVNVSRLSVDSQILQLHLIWMQDYVRELACLATGGEALRWDMASATGRRMATLHDELCHLCASKAHC